jgi:large subunit ribosomal protein L22
MKAELTNYRQSPRKVRLLADLVRGKKVSEAMIILDFTNKRAAKPIKKLIASAVANAGTNDNLSADDLLIKEIRVDKGTVLKRYFPRARGRASLLRKRNSHIKVALDKVVGDKIGLKK